MIATYVPPKKTAVTFEQAAEAMRAGLGAYMSESVRDDVLALALAKCALETGHWKSCWNWNWGNQKCPPNRPGMFTAITLNEVLVRGGKRVVVWFSPEGELVSRDSKETVGTRYSGPPKDHWHPQTRMCAFANRYDGAYEYVRLLAESKRYAKAWAALKEGNPAPFVGELHRAGYFTADPGPYKTAVVNIFSSFLGKLRGLPTGEWTDDWADLRGRTVELDQKYLESLWDDLRDRGETNPKPPDVA